MSYLSTLFEYEGETRTFTGELDEDSLVRVSDLASSVGMEYFYVDKITYFSRFDGRVETGYHLVGRKNDGVDSKFITIFCKEGKLREFYLSLKDELKGTNLRMTSDGEVRIGRGVRRDYRMISNNSKVPEFYRVIEKESKGSLWGVLAELIESGSKVVNIGSDGKYVFTDFSQLRFCNDSSLIAYELDGEMVSLVDYVTDWVVSDKVIVAVDEAFPDVLEDLPSIEKIEYKLNMYNIKLLDLQDYSLVEESAEDFTNTFSYSFFIRDYFEKELSRHKIAGMRLAMDLALGERPDDLSPCCERKDMSLGEKVINVEYVHDRLDLGQVYDRLSEGEDIRFLVGKNPTDLAFVEGFEFASSKDNGKFNYANYYEAMREEVRRFSLRSLQAHRQKIACMIYEVKLPEDMRGLEVESHLRIRSRGL